MNRRKQDSNASRGARIAHNGIEINPAQSFHTQEGTASGGQQARPFRRKRAKKNNYPPQHHREHGSGSHSQLGGRAAHSSNSVATVVPDPSASGAEPAAKEIPGFYFDPDKKKYFKITANHVFGSQHPYSQQSIKEKTKVKPDVEPIKKRPLRRFPSATSHYGRLGWFLQDCQLGLAGSPRRQLCIVHPMLVKTWAIHGCSEPLFTNGDGKYTHMTFDHAKQELYLASSRGDLWRYHVDANPVGIGSRMELDTQETSATTSLHLRGDNLLVASYLGGGAQPGKLKVYLRPEDSTFDPLTLVLNYSLVKSNIWSCDLDSDKIVLGGDRKVVLLRGWDTARKLTQSIWTASDVFSVQIDPPERRNIVYAGCRNGYVQIFDVNQPIPVTGPEDDAKKRTNLILQGIGHKMSSVNCMRRVSHHYLITAAMNGEILMWDTRFVGGYSSASSSGPTAKPVLDIREPLHNHFAKTSFDVNIDETLLAARKNDDELSVWSLSTGDRIQDLDVDGPVGCLSFSKTSQGIWAAVEDQLRFWGDFST